jgi:hypothetical protein
MKISVLALLVVAAVSVVVRAQQQPLTMLAAVKAIKCTFPVTVTNEWVNGEPQPQVKKAAVLTFSFDEIDTQEGSARFVGPTTAPEHIVAQLSGANLHFMDIRASGSLSITTVFAQESRPKKLKAVYTRTDFLPVTMPGFSAQPEVSQRYGECEILE